MRAEEGDESLQDYAAEAQETRNRIGRERRRSRLRHGASRLVRLFRRG